MDINDDLAECLQKLFLESEEISLRIGGYFTTTRKNRGIVVNNHQYYFKSESKNKDTRWVCNKYQCSASITTNLIWIFLEVTYARMLKELKDAALFAGFEFRPEFICLDFEKGAKKLGNKPHPNPWIFVELI